MRFEFKINDREITNPIARLVIFVIALLAGMLGMILVLFVLLPVFWFLTLAALLSVLILLRSLPRLRIYYTDVRKQRRLTGRERYRD